MRPTRLIVVAFLSLLLVPLTVVVAGKKVQKDDMNDRFAVQTFDPPAGGFVKTALVQNGSILIKQVNVSGLGPGEYGVVVTVGKLADGCDPDTFDPQAVVESNPITVKAGGGHLGLKNFFVNFISLDSKMHLVFLTRLRIWQRGKITILQS